ncbi:LEA type 2 family protein [Haloarculaceae archaeon H-GB2-1]|nr:LEA type 2 family protein [Haloarculaceae archaeon H-GB2-1]
MNAGAPLVSDPVLYVNETRGSWGEDVTRQQTPIDVAFDVYNPKVYPYAVSEIGYTIRMNGIPVGNGTTEDPATLTPKETTTIETTTTIDNDRLDEWWVSHLQQNQVTHLEIDFYAVVDPKDAAVLGDSVEPFRIDLESVDYETTIETDIFGTKTNNTSPAEASDETSTPESTTTTDSPTTTDGGLLSADETTTENGTDPILDGTTTDEGILDDSQTQTETSDTESTATETATATETFSPTTESTTTSDGGLLG